VGLDVNAAVRGGNTAKGGAIAIDGVDRTAGRQLVGERQREDTVAAAEVGPRLDLTGPAASGNQANGVVVRHPPILAAGLLKSRAMQSTDRLGRFLVALALIGFGVENLLFGRYIVARIAPWPPDDQSAQMIVGAAGALVFLAGGVAMLMGRSVRLAGLASAVFILAYSMILHWPVAFAGPAWSGHWTNVFKAASLAAGMVAVAAADGRRMSGLLATLTGLAPYVLAAFFLLAGVQHFMFTDFVSTLVPPFIPAPHFWTYFAGVALLAAGLGLCTPRFRLLAAVCSAAMVFSWVFLVHVPLVFALGREEWMGVVEALGISGVCLAVAQPPAARTSTR